MPAPGSEDVVAVHYLESLDSVRTGPGSGTTAEDARFAELQAFLEVLMALALGRSLVVPQSYAFDSGAFLRVAHRVLAARPATSEDRPFWPHLFGENGKREPISTFDEAVRDMLARVHDSERPFHSSLFPALSDMPTEVVAEVAAALDDRIVEVTGNAYAYPLLAVLREFRATERHRPASTPVGLSLSGGVSGLVRAPAGRALGLLGVQRDVYDRLRDAVRRLHEAFPGGFAQRSRLRQDLPWTGQAGDPSARDIAGDDLALVIEFVDTLYNRVVADSMGRPTALYSTAAAAEATQVAARHLAQELALGRSPLRRHGDDEWEVPAQVGVAGAKQDVRLVEDLQRLFEAGAGALEPLMDARSRRSSRFWRGAHDLAKAEADAATDPAAYERAKDRHLEHVASLLVGRADLTFAQDARIELTLHAAEERFSMDDPTGSPPALTSVAFSVAGLAARRGRAALITHGRRGRLVSALGSLVPAAPEEQHR